MQPTDEGSHKLRARVGYLPPLGVGHLGHCGAVELVDQLRRQAPSYEGEARPIAKVGARQDSRGQ